MQVASTGAQFYFYGRDGQEVAAMHRECNDEVKQMTIDNPDRFRGLAQIPMQDVDLAIAELDRCVNQLGLVGAMIDDKVNGKTFDEPEFLPLWKAAEQMGAISSDPPGRRNAGQPAYPRVPPAQHHRQPGGPGGDLCLLRHGRGNGRLSRPKGLPGPRGRLCLLRRGPHGPQLGRGPPAPDSPAPQRLPQPLLLRLPDPQRVGPPDAHRHGRNRQGGIWYRLALRHAD